MKPKLPRVPLPRQTGGAHRKPSRMDRRNDAKLADDDDLYWNDPLSSALVDVLNESQRELDTVFGDALKTGIVKKLDKDFGIEDDDDK